MRSLKRLMCAALAVLIVTCGMLAQGSAENSEQAVIEAEDESREAAEKEKAEKEAAEEEPTGAPAEEEPTGAPTEESTQKQPAEEPTQEPTETPTPESTEEPTQEPTQEPTEAPTQEPTSEPTEAPTPESTEEPTQEPTEEPTQEPTEEPTQEPTEEPTQEPTEEPTQEPTEEPTQEPTEEPTPEPTVEPTQLSLALVKTEGMTFQDGVYHMFTGQPASMMFAWNYVGECTGYHISLSDSQDELLSSGSPSETEYTLDLSALQSGQYVFLVEAMNDDEPVASARFPFVLSLDSEGPQGGPPGGSGSRGGAPGGASDMEQEQGFHITPGTALTGSHTSGTKDMLLYGALSLTLPETEMTELTLDDVSLGIVLDDGRHAFTAAVDADTLTLSAETGEVWMLNGRALRILSSSGIDTLMLSIDGREFALATDLPLTGGVYARLCAEGLVASDYEYWITDEGVFVWVAGELYRLDEAGTLTPMEGD